MTSYFDTVRKEIRRPRDLPEGQRAEALMAIERRMVEEVTVSAEHPTMPADYRQAIHATILKWGTATQPREAPPVQYEFNAEYAQRLEHLESGLHGIFHGLGSSGPPGWSDSPTRGRDRVLESGEEYREQLFRGEDPASALKQSIPPAKSSA